jgi:dTDP-glucose pyrophosphorylase
MAESLTKAVILARGLGTRMRRADTATLLDSSQSAAADAGLKAMVPVGRPFLDYVLGGLAAAGFRDICLVIGPEHGAVREYYDRQPLRRIAMHYAIQSEARGTADAVTAAEEFAGDDEFLVMNSDNYYPIDVLRSLREFDGPGAVLFKSEELVRNSNIPAERIQNYAYTKVAGGYLKRLMEKPAPGTAIPKDALVSMNLWRFTPDIFEHCRQVERSARGEYELPSAVNRAIDHGMRLRIVCSSQGVLDLSQRADIPAVAARLQGIEVTL